MANTPDQPPPDETARFWPFADGEGQDLPEERPGTAGETRVQSPVEEPPRWTARANVPRPGDPSVRRAAPQDAVEEWPEEEEDPYDGRSWLSPVIIGMVAIVLVAALSIGVWLIYRATKSGQNAPYGDVAVPPVASGAPSSAASAQASPTASAEPSESTASPGPASSSAPPAGPVVVPPLRGNSLAEATVKLQVLGLNVDIERRADDSLPPGEVLSSIPGEGETVAPGSTVTLVVATAPSPAPSRSQVIPSGSRR